MRSAEGPALLRPARAGEAAALSEIAFQAKSSWGYSPDFMAACRAELTVTEQDVARDEFWVSLDAHHAIAGFVHTVVADAEMEVLALFVAPPAMRRGHGRRLWDMIEQRARAQHCAKIGLDADPYAADFYRKMGLTVVGEVPSGSIPGRMLPRMAKLLDG